ncbi:DUF2829 domain-containing protein [Staphylococcus xylosus]|uniref:Thoeris anti-defense Tad2 family protein n=1 Tax=Staphylococcus pseudoxylosus TaxID=2282419 RepID=UPI000D1F6431|nr:DUF2829 domain-containing protein [Staphylococcus pseudoxylosus]PTI57026.1 DUF2829 domain-containing protein [Staphylococcus xylosus]
MNIQEAIKIAMEKGRTIHRTSEFDKTGDTGENLEIIPTNIYGYVVVKPKNLVLYKGWIPNAEDLIADDWEVVGLNPSSLDDVIRPMN